MIVNFLFDYKTPIGVLGFGYQKKELPEIFEFANKHQTDKSNIVYLQRDANKNIVKDSSMLLGELLSDGVNCHITYTQQLEDLKQIDSSIFLIPFESVNHKSFFSDFYDHQFDLDNCFSKKLIKYIKSKDNFKIIFSDSREGSYEVDEVPFIKMQEWLDRHDIQGKSKIIISCLNNKITKLIPNDNRFTFINPEFYISLAGKFIKEIETEDPTIISDRKRDDYFYDIKRKFESENVSSHFLFYNRNSSRIHRPYAITQLLSNNLFSKGIISLHKSEDFENQVLNNNFEMNYSFDKNELEFFHKIIKEYPYIIDKSDPDKVSSLHNFLSNSNDYEKTLFSIVGETSASEKYMFITEKTMKPIMNFHPFFVIGNPHTLQRLKEIGFKTFSDVWDESYDNEVDMKKRVKMIITEVAKLCEMELDELAEYFQKIKNICIYNREYLVKLNNMNYKYKQLTSVLKKDLV